MKKIQIINCVLAPLLCFCLGVFASCGKSTNESTDDNKNRNETENKPFFLEDDTLNILAIGNSFSDDTMEYVWQIAKDLGIENVYLGNLYIGGCSIDTHTLNAERNLEAYEYRTNTDGKWNTRRTFRMSDALEEKEWDFISMQQVSGSSGIQETYKNLKHLIKYVKDRAQKARLVWNMTWAYQQDTSHGEFYKYDCNQMTMYKMICTTVKNKVLSEKDIAKVVPNGTAIQNARTSRLGDHLTRDGYHLSLDLGRYITGLTFFHTLTEYPIRNIKFMPEGVTKSQQKIAIESAENAVKTPFEVTKSVH